MLARQALFATISIVALAAATVAMPASAEEAPVADKAAPAPDTGPDTAPDTGDVVVVAAKTTRSATAITQSEIQKILPGVSPLKAIQTLSLIHI